jgi:TP901 family phage tail tape measure protein
MADRFNPPVGGDLSAAIDAVNQLAARGAEAEAAVTRAKKAGDQLNEQEVKREAARQRVRERPYKEGSGAEDLEATLQARKRANAEILAEDKRAAEAEKRVAAARRAEMARLARVSEYRVVQQAPSGRVSKVLAYAETRPEAHTIAEQRGGVVQENPRFNAGAADNRALDRSVAARRAAAEAEIEAGRLVTQDVGLKAKMVASDEQALSEERRYISGQKQLVAGLEAKIAAAKDAGTTYKTADKELATANRQLARATARAAVLEEQIAVAKQRELEAAALNAGRLQRPGIERGVAGGVGRGLTLPTTGLFPAPAGSYAGSPDYRQVPFSSAAVAAAPPPPPPPKKPPTAPPPPPPPPPEDGRARVIGEVAREQENANRAIQRNTAILNANQNAYRAHGALTTEFINAAVRGETSYREWGYQIGATAAKFAGWTLVSVPVFAALDGVRRIGKGAIDASTGVNQLQRVLNDVDPGKAQGAFRSLSQEFNVPIAEATQAVYLMGQRFHDLPSAVNAAKAVLASFKTGDVSIEDSAKNLTAVVNGFGLAAEDLGPIFDKVNNAQNRFGVSINDTEQGLAKSAGAYKNAGGTVEYLTSLIAAAKLATGRTGQNVGTAVQRSVGFIQRPSNQSALQEFGIDPTKGIDEVYNQAFEKAKHLQGQQLQELATALSSPQYASYFVPLLQNYSNATSGFKRVLDSTLNESSGSAARELATVLGSVKERISEIGNELQRMGSLLAQAGAAIPFAALLTTLDQSLTVANSLLEVFNRLPDGIKTSAVALAEVYGLVRLARRTGVGEAIGQNAIGNFLSPSPERRATTIGRQAFTQNAEFLQGRVVGLTGRARENAFQLRVALAEEAAAEANLAALQKQLGSRTASAAEAEVIAEADMRLAAATTRSTELALATNQAETERLVASQALAEQTQIRAAFEASRSKVGFLEERGTVVTNDPNRATQQIGRFEEGQFRAYPTRLGNQPPPLAGAAGAATAAEAAVVAQSATAAQAASASQQLSRAAKQQAALQNFNKLRQEYGNVGTAYLATATAVQGAERAAAGAVGAGARLASGIGRIGTSVVEAFGPVGIAIGASFALYEVVKGEIEKQDEQAKRLKDATKGALTGATAARRRAAFQEDLNAARKPPGVTGAIISKALGPYSGSVLGALGLRDQERVDKDQKSIEETRRVEAENARALAAGKARPHVGSGEVLARLKDTRNEFRRGALTLAEYRKALDVIFQEAEGIKDSGKSATRSRISGDRLLAAPPKSQVQQLFGGIQGVNSVTGKVLDEQLDAYGSLVAGTDGSGRDFKDLVTRGLARLTQLSSSKDPALRGKAAELRQKIGQDLTSGAQAQLDQSLALARNQDDRSRAYATYNAKITAAQRNEHAIAQKAQQQVRRRLASVKSDLADAVAAPPADNQGLGFLLNPGQDDQRQSRVKALKARRDALEQTIKQIAKQDKLLAAVLSALFAQGQRSQAQDQEAVYDARAQVNSLRMPAGMPRAQQAVRDIGAKIARAIKTYGRDSAEVLGLIAQQEQAQQAVVQEQVDLVGAQGALSEARAGSNQGAAAGARISTLSQQLSIERAHPEIYKQADIVNLQASIVSAQNDRDQAAKAAAEEAKQKAEEARQKRLDTLRAHYELLESRTDDPVKIAELQSELADKVVKQGGGDKAERDRAKAEANKNRRAASQARGQARYDDIEFYSSIGKYTSDQELRALRGLEKTLKNNKQLKRTIQQRIYSLTHQDEQTADIDVGNIKLPTTYEIRRAVLGAQRGTNVTQQYVTNIDVRRPQDVAAVADHVDRLHRGTGASIRRAAGRA